MSDLISRQEAITVMELHMRAAEEPYQRAMNYAFDVAISCLLNLPSAEPKTGKWIDTTQGDHYKCSCCGTRAAFWFEEANSSPWEKDMSEWLSNFCPNCGAKMEK